MAANSDEEAMPWAWIRKLEEMVTNADYDRIPNLPAEILPWLYISDEGRALQKEKLKSLGITHVLSTNGAPSFHKAQVSLFYKNLGIVHKRIHAEDEEDYDMIEKHWDECYEFLKQVYDDRKSGAKVIVHCVAGINRSGLITCAAYMMFEQKNVLDVVKDVIDRRGPLLWNKSFQKELCLLALKHDLLGEKPAGVSDDPIPKPVLKPPPREALDQWFG